MVKYMGTDGPYKTLYADPPWMERGGGKIKRGADKHYKLLKYTEIYNILSDIDMEEDSHMWLWATSNHLPDAIKLMEDLGYRYITNIVWVKDRFGLGQYVRMQHELLLFGTKGKFLGYKNRIGRKWKKNISSIIWSKKREHSAKPYEVYDIIESISYPKYFEAFARWCKQGWSCMGDQVNGTIGRW